MCDGARVDAIGTLQRRVSGVGLQFVADGDLGQRLRVHAGWTEVARFTYAPRSWRAMPLGPESRWLIIKRSEGLAFEVTSGSVDEVPWLAETPDLGVMDRWPGRPRRRQQVCWFFFPLVGAILFAAWVGFLLALGLEDLPTSLGQELLVGAGWLPIVAGFDYLDRVLLQRRPRPAPPDDERDHP